MPGADLAAEIATISVGRQEPEDVGLLGGRGQIELVSHLVCLSFRSIEPTRMRPKAGQSAPDAFMSKALNRI